MWRRINDWAGGARLEYVFLVVALAWGVAQVFIVPPLQVPDEGDHWFRAWALTEGQLTADPQGSLELPGAFAATVDLYTSLVSDNRPLPPFLDGQPGFTSYEDLFDGPGSTGSISVVSRVASYGPVGYLPQAAGIGVGRLLGTSVLASFYMARLANLFVAVVLLFFAVRLAPFGKQLVVLLALLPMTMFELASVACDALTISGAIFFTSLLLWATTRPTLRNSHVALVITAAALLLNVKPGYEALVLLVLLLRPAQLGGRARYLAFVASNVLVVTGVFVIGFLLTGTADRAGTDAGATDKLIVVLQRPVEFLGILWSSLQDGLLTWTLESIGILGWFTVALPPALYLFVLVAGFGLFVGMEEQVTLQVWQRVVLAATSVTVFVTMAVALFVFLPNNDLALSFQGRYLAPVWLALLLSAYGIRFTTRRMNPLVVIVVPVVIAVANLQTLVTFYGR